ncbi:MAG: YcjF family protein [Paracoccaceae bacterium]
MPDDPKPLRRPALIPLDGTADPGLAAPVPDALPAATTMEAAARLATTRTSAPVRLALWAFGALFGFILSVALWDFVTSLLARNSLLGWTAFTLLSLAILAALILALREASAYMRLGRLDRLRAQTEAAAHDLPAARSVVADLTRLYANRPDTAWGRARLAEAQGEVMDADALLAMTETELLHPLDQQARREVEAAARRVAMVTALVPMALADVAMALFANLRMVRRIAEIYGGRAGGFGSWRLMRRVFGHLIATGAVALTDDLIGSIAGGGVLSKLSRRFGEGVVNGALTARVGVAAMEVCRPMPFVALPKPKVTNLVSRALTGLFGKDDQPL